MRVISAKTAGFCYGVNRAVNLLNDEILISDNIKTYGPIIHNTSVVDSFAQKGVEVVENAAGISHIDTVLIRSHGVSKLEMTEIEKKSLKIVDATCPFVKKIHNVVEKYYNLGYNIYVVGDINHPEVRGILGWCNNDAKVISSVEEVKSSISSLQKLCVVSQTTFERKNWEEISREILKFNANAVIIDTVCNATLERQNEVVKLSEICDAIIVIGDKKSSNSKRLADVAKKKCKNVFFVQDKNELTPDMDKFNVVGVTAGASTPACIIKEVVNMLEEREMNFEEAIESTLKPLNTGDIVKGKIFKITPTEVYVGLDTKADGIIPADQVTIKPNVNIEDILTVGQEVEAFVVRVNDIEGYVTLSMRKLESMAAQKEINEAFENKTPVTGVVTEVVKSGIIVVALGTKVFVPASLATERYTDDLTPMIGKEVTLRLIDFDRRRRKVVGSIKALLLEEKKKKSEAFWNTIEESQVIKGVVKSITNFGVFVDIGGVDGLVHITELSWQHIKHPSEVVKVGDILEVTVLSFDKEAKKISLGHKKAEDNPWNKIVETIKEGDIVDCKIVRLLPFGAFAEIIPGVDGLIHISQISNKRIAKPADVLELGQEVQAKVVDINNETQKIGLSMRALIEDVEVPEATEEVAVETDEAPVQESEVAETVEEAASEE
ncbi:MAG: bifunctional 4-hydroxy-3-methylbut-2-enyl diphosphate reductase/30S ribosomal protein S1 [Clostridia bacterium]|nr:bifunctional 4-hydroxy-3-methylbut-2-enyl diphosphate reductase/30S ribosomal protein S1 [Clostridia bacterium]